MLVTEGHLNACLLELKKTSKLDRRKCTRDTYWIIWLMHTLIYQFLSTLYRLERYQRTLSQINFENWIACMQNDDNEILFLYFHWIFARHYIVCLPIGEWAGNLNGCRKKEERMNLNCVRERLIGIIHHRARNIHLCVCQSSFMRKCECFFLHWCKADLIWLYNKSINTQVCA